MSPRPRQMLSSISILVALLLVACTGGAPRASVAPPSATPAITTRATASPASDTAEIAPDAWLVVGRAGNEGTRVILASTAEELYELPDGVPDETWGRLLGVSTDGLTTTVRNLVVQPGFGGGSQSVLGTWRLPTIGSDPMPVGVSVDRRTVVLVEGGADATTGARSTSRFAIVRTSFDDRPRIVALDGDFEYDALSPDGSTLYVVEHLAGPPAGHYQVRMVDVATGTLRPEVVADKSGGGEAMAGYPIAQVRRPDGMVFTLYRGAEHPFIHTLSSTDGWALCIDLPETGVADPAVDLEWGMAATPTGGSIVAVNATLGLAVEVSTGDLSVRRSVSFEPIAATGITLAKFGHSAGGTVGRRVVVAPRGNEIYAAGATGVIRLSTSDLTVTGRVLVGSAVQALAIPPDGGTLYALTRGGRIVGLDVATGRTRLEVPGTGYDRLLGVVPW